ncbi:MAG: 7-carboxy-7-deazaguanine synthase [Beijerinckiaceae bacterium]|nr:MAG: 7-carboxy-7-deazaguanine synthase [Beijerinckiaceae bacterium]
MSVYQVKEIFRTLQGEGAQAGRAAVFCRFAGCNLWSGRDEDRERSPCWFCDTDFVGTDGTDGGKFRTPQELTAAIAKAWGDAPRDHAYVVFTGGEPLLQLDEALLETVHEAGFACGLETNGTLPIPQGVDWVCVSPKASTKLQARSGDELKLVFPQEDLPPETLEELAFTHFFLQPMDGPQLAEYTAAAVAYCQEHPRWRLSLQTHKWIGLR